MTTPIPDHAVLWDEIRKHWASAYVLRCDPDAPAGRRYSARPVSVNGEDGTLYAATPRALLDVIKDDARRRPLAVTGEAA